MDPKTEIQRTESTLSQIEQLNDAVAAMLAIAARMLKGAPELTKEDVELWTSLLYSERILPTDIGPALQRYMAKNRFFPTPADIIEEANAISRARQAEYEARRATETRLRREDETLRLKMQEEQDWQALSPEEQAKQLEERKAKRREIEAKLEALGGRALR